jgi:hypothetical protein
MHKQSTGVTSSLSGKTEASSSAPSMLKVGAAVETKTGNEYSAAAEDRLDRKETPKRDKVNILLRKIIDFQKIFDQIVELSGSDAFILLDDLYHLRRADQPQVLDYFHRIVKGRSVWLKIGTIRHRTDWYWHGNPPTGLKLGDDCDDIDLDITLEKYELARTFLLQIIDQIIKEAGLPGHKHLLADGGVERLVLASGGVARDFLTIFRKAVDVARERGKIYRGDRINAEDVNRAAGEHDRAKRDELRRDTEEGREALEKALSQIRNFCVENNVNCFLVEQTDAGNLLDELVDLRFVHIVRSRTTVREQQGTLYTAYMLDISQYTGERLRRDPRDDSFLETGRTRPHQEGQIRLSA